MAAQILGQLDAVRNSVNIESKLAQQEGAAKRLESSHFLKAL